MSSFTKTAIIAAALAALATPALAFVEYQGVLAIDTASAGCAFGTSRADDVTVGEQIRIFMQPNDIGGNTAQTLIFLYRTRGVMRIARIGSIAGAGSLKTFMINKLTLVATETTVPHSNVVFTPANIAGLPDTFKLTGTIIGGFFDTDATALTGCTVTFTAHLAKEP